MNWFRFSRLDIVKTLVMKAPYGMRKMMARRTLYRRRWVNCRTWTTLKASNPRRPQTPGVHEPTHDGAAPSGDEGPLQAVEVEARFR